MCILAPQPRDHGGSIRQKRSSAIERCFLGTGKRQRGILTTAWPVCSPHWFVRSYWFGDRSCGSARSLGSCDDQGSSGLTATATQQALTEKGHSAEIGGERKTQ